MKRNQLYYLLKPYVPWHIRMTIRRLLARRIRQTCHAVWPINPAASQLPKGWNGWPEGKKFAVVLTHDVEGREGLEQCRNLMRIEMKLGFRSCFNFIPRGDYSVPVDLRDELKSNGFEVGVHDFRHDGKLYQSRKLFSANAKEINRYLKAWQARGFRSGFMLHNLDWIGELEISYDASTFDTDPFEPQADGANTIFPFWVESSYNGGFVELPYTLPQDSTLFLLLRERTTDIWRKKLDWVAAAGGMVLLNVHPDYLRFRAKSPGAPTVQDHYLELLRYLQNSYGGDFWHALPAEVAAFVRRWKDGDRPITNIRS